MFVQTVSLEICKGFIDDLRLKKSSLVSGNRPPASLVSGNHSPAGIFESVPLYIFLIQKKQQQQQQNKKTKSQKNLKKNREYLWKA